MNPINDLLNEYYSAESSSIKAHQKKIRDYIDEFKPQSFSELFDAENLRTFIFARGENISPKNTRYALVNLHNYARKNGYIDKREVFPIDPDETPGLNTRGKKGKVFYLNREIDLNLFYTYDASNFKDNEVRLIVRACLALCLSVGYGVTSIQSMLVSDYDPIDKSVKNPYYKDNDQNIIVAEWIKLVPPALECIDEFWSYFWEGKRKGENNFFIMSVAAKQPIDQLRITLNEISNEMGLNRKLTPQDLRGNMILHSLYQSNGSSLIDLLRIFGKAENAFMDALNRYYESSDIYSIYSFDPHHNDQFSDNEDLDSLSTIRRDGTVSRIVRDTKLTQSLKKEYDHSCQICGMKIQLNNFSYSEGHHIKPVGRPHHGPDIKANILVLCPNHHVMFDLGILAVDPESYDIFIIENNKYLKFGTKLYLLASHYVNPIYLRYHWQNIFLPNIYKINRVHEHIR